MNEEDNSKRNAELRVYTDVSEEDRGDKHNELQGAVYSLGSGQRTVSILHQKFPEVFPSAWSFRTLAY
jgi:hypothetical protein